MDLMQALQWNTESLRDEFAAGRSPASLEGCSGGSGSRPESPEDQQQDVCWSSGDQCSAQNLERNVRWLTNSLLLPSPPAKLSAPQFTHRGTGRKPVYGGSRGNHLPPSFRLSCRPQTSVYSSSSSSLAPPPLPVAPPPPFTHHRRRPRQRGSYHHQRRRGRDAVLLCPFCRQNGETREFYTTHMLKDGWGRVICPVLRAYTCPNCGLSGDHAHTINYCPYNSYS